MVRGSAIVMLLAVLGVVALAMTNVVWSRNVRPEEAAIADPNAVVLDFTVRTRPSADLDLGARYGTRAELVDPKRTLPTWHLHPRTQAAAVFAAIQACPPGEPRVAIDDASLAELRIAAEDGTTLGPVRLGRSSQTGTPFNVVK